MSPLEFFAKDESQLPGREPPVADQELPPSVETYTKLFADA
jgi:hypothetical protein